MGSYLKWDGDFDGARRWFEQTYQAALDEGDEGSLPYALSHLPQVELWSGNWARAEGRALEHLEFAERTGQSLERLTAIYNVALVGAHRGRTDEARTNVEEALPEASDQWCVYQLCSVLGFIELSAGRYADAVAPLRRAAEIFEGSGALRTTFVYEDYAESLVLVGDLDAAEQIVAAYQRWALRTNKASALRCLGLWRAARQELDEAISALDEALVHHQQVKMPFGRARTLLILGQVRRRRGERKAARDALSAAITTFDEFGAPLWAERATAELGRVPIRRAADRDGLTATEERVAKLVAGGRTNKEVAQELFLSVKTVESNLTRIYRKLGVRSRSALAAGLAAREEDAASAKP